MVRRRRGCVVDDHCPVVDRRERATVGSPHPLVNERWFLATRDQPHASRTIVNLGLGGTNTPFTQASAGLNSRPTADIKPAKSLTVAQNPN